MTTTDFTKDPTAPELGAMGAGAAVFSRLEKKPRRSKWMAAIPVAVIAVFAVGGVLTYESMSHAKPAPAALTSDSDDATRPAPAPVAAATPLPAAAPAPVAAATPAPTSTPTPHRSASGAHTREDCRRDTQARAGRERGIFRWQRQRHGEPLDNLSTTSSSSSAPPVIVPPPAATPDVTPPTPDTATPPSGF